ncbi:hypothetical protein [Streptomyces sp. Isolate_219]|uniref:hypothetical protein n=1 Tax=Streptomyces sp. Isolate_219 TaxID=2950110 RepID=UPI0021C573D7|nr:hypothetical protein [Streptomyces sp. Isolate_219]MCR8575025.1 hypothetical protein [Streptomyces sp. Isolate_219]
MFETPTASLSLTTQTQPSKGEPTLTSAGPRRDAHQGARSTAAADGISNAERELYGGRLRWDQTFVRYEGALTRLKFGQMAAALPRMVGMVLRTGWEVDRRALTGVVTAQVGQGVTAAWGLVAVNRVLTQLFADGPTPDKLRQALPSLVVLAVVSVGSALLAAWSTAMSGRLEPQVERAVSARYYAAVTRVEVEATERPEVQRVLEAGRFGTDSARSMLRLSVGVGSVLIGMVAAAVVLVCTGFCCRCCWRSRFPRDGERCVPRAASTPRG